MAGDEELNAELGHAIMLGPPMEGGFAEAISMAEEGVGVLGMFWIQAVALWPAPDDQKVRVEVTLAFDAGYVDHWVGMLLGMRQHHNDAERGIGS